jgi:hypothetical protein
MAMRKPGKPQKKERAVSEESSSEVESNYRYKPMACAEIITNRRVTRSLTKLVQHDSEKESSVDSMELAKLRPKTGRRKIQILSS